MSLNQSLTDGRRDNATEICLALVGSKQLFAALSFFSFPQTICLIFLFFIYHDISRGDDADKQASVLRSCGSTVSQKDLALLFSEFGVV